MQAPSESARGSEQAHGRTREVLGKMASLTCLGGLYIVTSVCMTAFNKYLISPKRFPYAMFMALLHSGVSSVFAFLLLLFKPSMFPAITNPAEKVTIDQELATTLGLVAFLFAFQCVFSNTAYLYSSMVFIQMMKEANLVVVYCLSLLACLESFSWVKWRIILLIIAAAVLTITGEVNFSVRGFVTQSIGQFIESAKIVLQSLLLVNRGKKLDVLTYVLLVMPVCFFVLAGFVFVFSNASPAAAFQTPKLADIITWWPLLAANSSLAFGLNIAIALFMKHSSAVAFVLAGIVKDGLIVLTGFILMHEPISKVQVAGFSVQLFLVWLWAMAKCFPDKFENGITSGLIWLLYPRPKKGLLDEETTTESADYGSEKRGRSDSSTA